MKHNIWSNAYFSIYNRDNKISIAAHKTRAVIIPITTDNKFVLIRSYKKLIERYSLEFPRGFIEKNEDSIEGAKRELSEEIGGSSTDFKFLGSSTVNNGLSTEIAHYYVAFNITLDSYILEKERDIIDTVTYALQELLDLITKNRIEDSYTLVALMKYISTYEKV